MSGLTLQLHNAILQATVQLWQKYRSQSYFKNFIKETYVIDKKFLRPS